MEEIDIDGRYNNTNSYTSPNKTIYEMETNLICFGLRGLGGMNQGGGK